MIDTNPIFRDSLATISFYGGSMGFPLGHFMDLGQVFSFSEKAVEVRSFVDNYKTEYPFVMPYHPGMPLEVLFSDKAIPWLLRSGCVPKFVEGKVTLAPGDEISTPTDQLLTSYDRACSEVRGNKAALSEYEVELSAELLQAFKSNLEAKKYDFSASCLESLCERHRDSVSVLALYADFLFFLKKPKATGIYLALSEKTQALEKRTFIEKALLSDPENIEIYEKLEQLYPQAQRIHIYLFGFTYLFNKAPQKAEEVYQRAQRLGPQDPLLLHARLNCLGKGEKRKKKELYVELARLYQDRKEESLSNYYLSKNPEAFSGAISARPPIIPQVIKPGPLERIGLYFESVRVSRRPQNTEPDDPDFHHNKKKGYLEFIDGLIKNLPNEQVISLSEEENPELDSFTSAAQVVNEVLKSTRNTPLEHNGAFHKRLVTIYAKQCKVDPTVAVSKKLRAALNELWQYYFKNKKFEKAEIVARTLCQKFPDFDSGFTLAETLFEEGKQAESAKLYFSLAKSEFYNAEQDHNHIRQCLHRLIAFDQQIFTKTEQQTIYLLGQIVGAAKHRPVELKKEEILLRKGLFLGKGYASFPIDHPEYVGCYFGLTDTVFFTGKIAEWTSSRDGKVRKLPLDIPHPPQLPAWRSISSRETIRWLLEAGYVPIVKDGKATLVSPSDPSLKGPLIDRCNWIVEELREDVEVCRFLGQFQSYLEQEQYSLAENALKRAAEGTKAISVKELYADFLYFRQKHKEAIDRYSTLSFAVKGGEWVYYIEKTLQCDPLDGNILSALLTQDLSPERLSNLYTFVFLHLYGHDLTAAESLYKKVAGENPLAHFALLSCLDRSDKIQRMKVFRCLAEHYKGDSQTAAYYHRRKELENSSTKLEDLRRYFDEEIAKLLKEDAEGQDINKRLKDIYIEFIDILIINQLYDEAESIINIVINLFKRRCVTKSIGEKRYKGEKSAFSKRELVLYSICGKEKELKAALERLQEFYTRRDKPEKALLATRLGYESLRNLDTCNTFATELFLQNKKRESVHVYLEGALFFASHQLVRQARICVEQIRTIDSHLNLFDDDEKLLIGLLESLVRLKKAPLPLG